MLVCKIIDYICFSPNYLIPILLVNYLIIKKLENSKVIFPYHADYQQDKKG